MSEEQLEETMSKFSADVKYQLKTKDILTTVGHFFQNLEKHKSASSYKRNPKRSIVIENFLLEQFQQVLENGDEKFSNSATPFNNFNEELQFFQHIFEFLTRIDEVDRNILVIKLLKNFLSTKRLKNNMILALEKEEI